jgi:hypothetical protein
VQHRVTEKRLRYRHSFVMLRETKLGMFGKAKERFAILNKTMLALYDANAEEVQIKEPLSLTEINASCTVQECSPDSGYTYAVGMGRAGARALMPQGASLSAARPGWWHRCASRRAAPTLSWAFCRSRSSNRGTFTCACLQPKCLWSRPTMMTSC